MSSQTEPTNPDSAASTDDTTDQDVLPATRLEFACIAALGIIMIVGFIFVPPKSTPIDGADVLFFSVGLILLCTAAFVMIIRQFTGRARRDTRLRILSVLVLIIAMLMFFAVSFYRLSGVAGEIDGLQTHLDAIYFTVSTSMTVGFGDVVAKGQMGRFVVLVQMVFNIVVLAAASKLITTLFIERRKVKLNTD